MERSPIVFTFFSAASEGEVGVNGSFRLILKESNRELFSELDPAPSSMSIDELTSSGFFT